jgi:hypothetical protein
MSSLCYYLVKECRLFNGFFLGKPFVEALPVL